MSGRKSLQPISQLASNKAKSRICIFPILRKLLLKNVDGQFIEVTCFYKLFRLPTLAWFVFDKIRFDESKPCHSPYFGKAQRHLSHCCRNTAYACRVAACLLLRNILHSYTVYPVLKKKTKQMLRIDAEPVNLCPVMFKHVLKC